MLPGIVVQAVHSADDKQARELAARLNLDVLFAGCEPDSRQWLLLLDSSALALRRPDGTQLGIDFTRGKPEHRRHEPGSLRQPLARALGLRAYQKRTASMPSVLDTTAGLGQDAWVIATLGCRITMLEQSAIVHELLSHALSTALQSSTVSDVAERIQLHNANATRWMQLQPTPVADVIYLDPMYPTNPAKRNRALVKKGMQFLRELTGTDTDGSLLSTALGAARWRVVVKRPKGALPLTGAEQWQGQVTCVDSPNTRYDVYHLG